MKPGTIKTGWMRSKEVKPPYRLHLSSDTRKTRNFMSTSI